MEFFTSKDGLHTAKEKKQWLHSSYKPMKEAEDYLASLKPLPTNKTIIVMDLGFGYFFQAVKKAYPNHKIITILFSQEAYDLTTLEISDAHIVYKNDKNLNSFILKELKEHHLPQLEIMVWPAITKILTPLYEEIYNALLATLTLLKQNIYTTNGFGQRWFNNTVKNIYHRPVFLQLTGDSKWRAIAIVASGPSLQKSLPWLAENQAKLDILCLPSAFEALCEWGISPDYIISTDAGYWAKRHLDRVMKQDEKSGKSPLVIAPLLAALPPHLDAQIPFATSNQLDYFLMKMLKWPLPFIAEKGTVLATAIEWCHLQKYNKIISFGFDLCFDDLKSHVIPSTSYNILAQRSEKLAPLMNHFYDFKYHYDAQNTKENPMQIYARWFNQESYFKQMCYRYSPSHVEIQNFTNIYDTSDLSQFLAQKSQPSIEPLPYDSQNFRQNILLKTLDYFVSTKLNESLPELLYFLNTDKYLSAQKIADDKQRKQEENRTEEQVKSYLIDLKNDLIASKSDG